MNANAAVYDLIRANKRPPTPRAVYEMLGLTKRQYYALLRWLQAFQFIERKDARWASARVKSRYCACGAEITPESASYRKRDGKLYVRTPCATCYNAQQVRYATDWRKRHPESHARAVKRHKLLGVLSP